ncbi:hypothetical protein J2X53_003597 [Pseudorhodobacter sp. 4114]|nr:hypothetical protein [Pseudorhodobacter sp. 4114]
MPETVLYDYWRSSAACRVRIKLPELCPLAGAGSE